MSYGGDYSDNSQKGADTILGAMSRDLGTPERRGVALQNSTGTGAPALYDDGTTRTSTSTLAQGGRAVAAAQTVVDLSTAASTSGALW
ncbi:hypothetical protein MY10362_008079 [Beauveria mimosiformis]